MSPLKREQLIEEEASFLTQLKRLLRQGVLQPTDIERVLPGSGYFRERVLRTLKSYRRQKQAAG